MVVLHVAWCSHVSGDNQARTGLGNSKELSIPNPKVGMFFRHFFTSIYRLSLMISEKCLLLKSGISAASQT